jgi:hypothetical protein
MRRRATGETLPAIRVEFYCEPYDDCEDRPMTRAERRFSALAQSGHHDRADQCPLLGVQPNDIDFTDVS